MKIAILFIFIVAISGCSSYKIKLGKKCIDNEKGGQSWSRIWFVQKNTVFNKCDLT